MARAIWKGSISFGLVEIPVGVFSAESSEEIGFTMLDKRDLAPVGYKRYNKKTGEEVPWAEIVKGYEYEPDQYVVMTEADFKRANVAKTQTIDIVNFVDAEEIASWFYEAPYYLEPLKKDSKGYALLREALVRTKKVGIATFVLRQKEHLAAVVARGDVLVLNTLRYTHEIRDPKDLTVPTTNLARLGVSQKELQMAEQLVNGLSEEWNPERFKDTYRDDLLALVEKKIKAGQTHVIEEPGKEEGAPRRAEVVDLMPLLRDSLAAASTKGGRAALRKPDKSEAREEAESKHHAASKKTAKKKTAAKPKAASRRASRSA